MSCKRGLIYKRLEYVANKYGNHAAIIHEINEITYSDLLENIRSLSEQLKKMIEQEILGKYVGIMIKDPIVFTIVYIAFSITDRTIVPLDSRFSIEEIRETINQCGLDSLIYTKDVENKFQQFSNEIYRTESFNTVLNASRINQYSDKSALYRYDDFIIQFTSGSSGKAKAICLREMNIYSRVMNWAKMLDITNYDNILCTLTLYHSHGTDCLMLPGLLSGATVVAPDIERLTPVRIFNLIKHHNVSIFSSLPYFYELAVKSVTTDKFFKDSLRYLISGSAPLSNSTAQEFYNKFGFHISQVYGLSEIGIICFNKQPENVGYVGQLEYGIKARLYGGSTSNEGELYVKGVSLSRGYLDSPQDQMEMYQSGWLATKDIVQMDEKGIKIIGRKSRFINVGGNKVDPHEIENVIKSLPEVEDVVVLADSSPIKGETPIAFVTFHRNYQLDVNAIQATCQKVLTSYKIPSHIIILDSIPKNPIGKIQFGALRQFLPSNMSN